MGQEGARQLQPGGTAERRSGGAAAERGSCGNGICAGRRVRRLRMGPPRAVGAALCVVLFALVASAAASDFCGGSSAGGAKADLVVVLDETASMKMDPVVGFVKGLANLLAVGPSEGESRLALVTFRASATTRVGFSSQVATDRSLFYSELDKMTPYGSGTATGPALEFASRLLQAARVDAVKVAVIATDLM